VPGEQAALISVSLLRIETRGASVAFKRLGPPVLVSAGSQSVLNNVCIWSPKSGRLCEPIFGVDGYKG
jgi:hypothetical protein